MNANLRHYGAALFLCCLLLLFLYAVRSVAVPFLLALLLAYFLDPAADALERRVSRPLAVCCVFGAFLLFAGALLGFLVPALKGEVAAMQQALPGYAESLYRLVPQPVFDLLGIGRDEELRTALDRLLAGTRNLSFDLVNQVAVFLSRAFSSTLGFLLAVLGYCIIPIYLFYLLRDFDRLKEGALSLVPLRHRRDVLEVGREIDGVLGGFIRGQLTVCMILAALYGIGLLVIGIDLALVIGLISGAAFVIPYLGTILGIALAGVMALVKFHDILHPALVVGWFALVQGLEGAVITPRLVGDRVGLHPLATILAVLVGGELFGFLGLLLAVPAVASANILVRRLLERYRQTLFFVTEGDR